MCLILPSLGSIRYCHPGSNVPTPSIQPGLALSPQQVSQDSHDERSLIEVSIHNAQKIHINYESKDLQRSMLSTRSLFKLASHACLQYSAELLIPLNVSPSISNPNFDARKISSRFPVRLNLLDNISSLSP